MNLYKKSEIPEHLHKYFEPAEIGLEQTPEDYVNELVTVFREVKRVLRDDGTLWLNLGDSYSGSGKGIGSDHGKAVFSDENIKKTNWKQTGLKPKDLIGIPWRVAFALQADGWYLRQDIIWAKNNPMPESVQDRCTKSHEYIFLLSKSKKYYFDNEAIKEKASSDKGRGITGRGGQGSALAVGCNGRQPQQDQSGWMGGDGETRNKRSVWNVNTRPYKASHFATFPPELIEPCILAGCPENGTVLDPFGGSGTVGQVCNQLGRDGILIELNPEYKHLIEERINMKPTIKRQSKKRNEVNHLSKVALQQNLLHYIN
jgi:DNA modification methylase